MPIEAHYIIPRNQHKLSKTDISNNALKVLNRLNSSGFQAFLVGGSVRDLLLGKVPKDFDIATNATPSQIKNLFRNGRIIGRRFKLVHILFHRNIIEVATFRGSENVTANQLTNDQGIIIRDNVYGTLDEDAWRRDFTINSLYYNIDDASIVDYTGGFKDIHNRILRIIGNAKTRYQEDPVRMLRAIRFSAKLHFELAPETAAPIPILSALIRHISSSRLFDEIIKLYQCGEAERAQSFLVKYSLFEQLFPQTHALFDTHYPVKAFLGMGLENTDARVRDNKPITPAFLFAILLWFPLLQLAVTFEREEHLHPLPALEKAMSQVIFEQNQIIAIPKRFSQVIREIWLLQFRFAKRFGTRPLTLLQHPRFRAAYDFLALRALVGDAPLELVEWWTTFQDATDIDKSRMIAEAIPEQKLRKKKK